MEEGNPRGLALSCLPCQTEYHKAHGKYTNTCLTEQGMLPFRNREKTGYQRTQNE